MKIKLSKILEAFENLEDALENFDPKKPPKLTLPVSVNHVKYQVVITAKKV